MALTIANIATAFATAAPPAPVYDDRVNDTQVQALIVANNAANGVAFNGYTNQQTVDTLINFLMEAACLHANSKTSVLLDVSPQGAPQAITYNALRNMINTAGIPLTHFYTAFATEIYNTMRRLNRYPEKYADFGFTYEHRWIAFPSSNKIKQELATPPIDDTWFTAANLNKIANIAASQTSSPPKQLTVHEHYFHGGQLPGRNAGLLTQ